MIVLDFQMPKITLKEEKMREKELLAQLAEKRGISIKEAESILDDYNAIVKNALKKGEEVVLNDMGKFVVQARPAREARNPMTGQTVKVPAKTVAKWKPNKKFKDEVFGEDNK